MSGNCTEFWQTMAVENRKDQSIDWFILVQRKPGRMHRKRLLINKQSRRKGRTPYNVFASRNDVFSLTTA